ncbi:hypothetical protein GIB67_038256 [Kingdonia uniflora]|uniref:Pentatricopeptide repeat-containing protein n=1 Tax=Kingdonia uniflora TaxID=39325 RepID=A0A7J7MSW5_9MAGN|nr:hypothetical protein GIB67_038256 [Kingdonia uniflora]
MRKMGVLPDGFTLPLVVRACASMAEMGSPQLCKTVHGHVLVSGFQSHLHVSNELIGVYSKIGCLDYSTLLFDRMPQRSHSSWNTMISGFSRNFDCDNVVGLFRRMELEGFEPNIVTWTTLLSAHARCGRHEDAVVFFGEFRKSGNGMSKEAIAVVLSVCANADAFNKGKEFHGYIVSSGFQDYIIVKNSLICMYGKHGILDDATTLFSEMEVKSLVSWNTLISSFAEAGYCDEAFEVFSQLEMLNGPMVKPNVISWTAVIGGYASKGRGDECLEIFRKMLCARVDPNSVTIASILSVCAEVAALGLGKEIHSHVVRALMDKNILVGNGLLHMYTKCGSIKDGRLVFDNIKFRDLISWNSMIAGYGIHGYGEDALTTFHKMTRAEVKPDGITFVALLSACNHAGLVAEGRKLFDQMVDKFSVQPHMEHYSCIVDLLGRAGLLQEASEIIKMMPMKPNVCVWGALLNSSRMHRNTGVAEEAASHMFSLESEMDGSYILLSNLYARCGRWEDSANVRVLAKTKGLKKTPGQSWIEVKKKLYMFFSGNALQPGSEGIFKVLTDLCLRMESEGYSPDKSFVLQDVGEEE